ncbi:palmitoyltransferase ZDHHC22-like [Diadema antillarum]|uniref:palmitoyltransferase ZDHHC22-like n=1 Tax=Diadema antillarum TaxID=105358 RepID=UPI003A88C871
MASKDPPTRQSRSKDDSMEMKVKQLVNSLGFLFIVLAIFAGFASTMIFTIPQTVEDLDFTGWKHRLYITYALVASLGHFILAMHTDTSLKIVHSVVQQCEIDQRTSQPFRAHQCRLCESVILKHDHHCFMLGKCIGYHNQKYFIWFCFHIAMAAFYMLFQIALYLSLAYDVQFPGAWTYFVLLPRAVMRFVRGETECMELALTMYLYICLIGGFVALGFFMWEVGISAAGLTSFEALHGQKRKTKHSNTISHNLKDTFGAYWFLGMILPVRLPQCGTGLYSMKSCS